MPFDNPESGIFKVPPLVVHSVTPSHAPIGSKSSPMAQVLALTMSSTLPQAPLQMTTMAPCPHPCSRLTGESMFVQIRVPAVVLERVLDRVRAPMQLLDMVRCLRMALVKIAGCQNVPKETVPIYLKIDAELPLSSLDLWSSVPKQSHFSIPMVPYAMTLRLMIPMHLIRRPFIVILTFPHRRTLLIMHPIRQLESLLYLFQIHPSPHGTTLVVMILNPHLTDHYVILPHALPLAAAWRVVLRTPRSHDVHAGFMFPGEHLQCLSKVSRTTS